MSLLTLTDVVKRFRCGASELTVLDSVCLEVQPGELIGLYGERRGGKSTLLRLMAGLLEPDSGTIAFDGKDVLGMSLSARARLRRRDGVALACAGNCVLGDGRLVVEHVALPLTNDGLTLGESEGLARIALERVGAGDLAHLPTDMLSVGDRVHVELARAIAREPRLLLVDEPAVLPGPSESRSLNALLRSFASESGIAVVIASQDMTALAGARRLLTLSDGRLRGSDSRRRVIPFPGARAAAAAQERA